MPLNLAYLFDLYTWENEYSVVLQNSKGPSFRVVTEKLQNKLKMRTVLQETNQMFGDDAFLRRSFRRSISHWLHPWGWTTDSQCLWYGNQILQFKHQFSRLHIQSKFGHQRKQCLKKTSKKILCQASRPYPEKEDQPRNQKFVWQIFNPGGHMQFSPRRVD